MRKNIFKLTGAILALITLLTTHIPCKSQFRYGIRLGGEISTATLSGHTSTFHLHHGSGFAGGLTCEYLFREEGGPALGGSILYSHGSAMEVVGPTGSKDTRKLGNDFLEIPLHLKYKYFFPSTKGIFGTFAYTGPSFRMRLDKDAPDIPAGSRRFQPGWDIGLGIDVINFIQLSAGYRFGLNDALHPGQAKLRADGVQISAAILFDI
ncbi:MAG: PorT family protein [Muribaculaceae bacterium]|nr:PorT family protein [Muribaculaceae bacterium]